MEKLPALDPHSDGLSPISLERLHQQFSNGVRASVLVGKEQLGRLPESSIHLLEPISVIFNFDGKDQLDLSFRAHVSANCTRCAGLVERHFDLLPTFSLFQTADEADRAMMADPDLDAIATEDLRCLAELVEDEILLELGHGLVHEDCRPNLHAQPERPKPFQDLAQLLSMKKPP
jgi:uncharacterized metal-binding protein YceD (DUF177 family)